MLSLQRIGGSRSTVTPVSDRAWPLASHPQRFTHYFHTPNCHWKANWMQFHCHTDATWLPLDNLLLPIYRQSNATWLPLDTLNVYSPDVSTPLPLNCHLNTTWLPLNIHLTATRLSLDCLSTNLLPIHCRLAYTWHSTSTYLPLYCHLTFTWLTLDYKWSATQLPLDCYLTACQPIYCQLKCHLAYT